MSIKKPLLLVFAGPNGSGKSTVTGFFEIVGEYTNADDIVASTGFIMARKMSILNVSYRALFGAT